MPLREGVISREQTTVERASVKLSVRNASLLDYSDTVLVAFFQHLWDTYVHMARAAHYNIVERVPACCREII